MKSSDENDCRVTSEQASLQASQWIVCQLGAREHYAIPRALHLHKKLALLIVDIWFSPESTPILTRFRKWLPRLRTRAEESLHGVPIAAFTKTFVLIGILKQFASSSRVAKDLVTRFSDRLFQVRAARQLTRLHSFSTSSVPTVFCYSYSARNVFRAAKRRGWHTVLGQINPGPREEEIVREIYQSEFGEKIPAPNAPAGYWKRWREECTLADAIIVNSEWSRQLVNEAGVDSAKLHIIPLAYEPPAEALCFERHYPESFTEKRPLRVLYLGSIHARKGVHVLARAAHALSKAGAPVEFLIVGRDEWPGGLESRLSANVRQLGEVDRKATGQFYRWADVFILPTFSDGFALTLLEAQAWHLPIISSRFCGRVVEHQKNGFVLGEISQQSLESALHLCLTQPASLRSWSRQIVNLAEFSLQALASRLDNVVHPYSRLKLESVSGAVS